MTDRMEVAGIPLEMVRRGSGPPLLLLHGMQPLDAGGPFLERLARNFAVVAPSHPGFGRSARPDGFETVYDLVHLYLALLDALPEKAVLVGLSFGGWLAAEIAVKSCHKLARLVLVDAFGLKLSDRETGDIVDVFNAHPDDVRRLSWHDPERWAPDFDTMSDEALVLRARNWNALCLYGWQPYMYTPRLAHWLGRVSVPTLVAWGASDGIVTPAYGRGYAERIPGARFVLIDGAGHHPEIEQAAALADLIATA